MAFAKTYLEVNPSCRMLVLDSQGSVGGTWAAERIYRGLSTNNIVGTFGYSDFQLKPEEWDIVGAKYNPGSVVHAYFTAYAKKFGVFGRTLFNAKVESTELQPDDSWNVQYIVDMVETTVHTKKLVLATGTTFKPYTPRFNGSDIYKGKIFHTRDLASMHDDMNQAEHITVLGGSKSAIDAVYINAVAGKKVNWVFRGMLTSSCSP